MSTFSQKLDGVANQLATIKGDESQEIPAWVSTLLTCFESLIDELKQFNQLTIKVDKLEDRISVSENVCDTLVQDRDRLSEEIENLKLKMDEQEQRSRNVNLLIHGVPEVVGEKATETCLKFFLDELTIDASTSIVRSHRLGPIKMGVNTRNSKPRPLICKFNNFEMRKEIFNSKKSLKGKRFVITENLTKRRYELLQAAVTKLGRGNVWTNEGHILTKCGLTIKSIKAKSDLDGI